MVFDISSLRALLLCTLPALALLAPVEANAQEIQRPFTEDGDVQIIDRGLENKLHLFPEYEGFREARLYERPDSAYVLEIVYQPDQDVLRERQTLSPADVKQLRAKVSSRLSAQRGPPPLDQSGRTELLVTSTLLSLGFYGYALPLALNVDGGTEFGAIYLLTSGTGFFAPFMLTRDRSVTEGQAKLFQYASTRGIAHGELLALLIAGDGEDVPFFGTALLSSIAEGLFAYGLAASHDMSQGTAETIGVGGDYGIGLGIGAAYLIDPDDAGPRLVAVPALIGAAAGLYAGYRLTRPYIYTPGDARVLRITGALGGLLALTAVDLTGTGDGRALVGGAMAGTLGGLGLGANMLQDLDFSGSSGTFIALGTLGGGLMGLGTGALMSDIEDDVTPFLTLGSLGAAGGFLLMYRIYVDEARAARTGWNIQINSGGLAARWLPSISPTPPLAPVLTIRRTF